MKITLSWLNDYVDYTGSPEELARDLTMLGLEVEGMETVQPEFEGIVVAEVLEKNPHPDADKLSVCRVNDGKEVRQIVCGASNFKAGDKVPLILPGATLPAAPGEKPFTIKVGKIRGVESHGMMCSPSEIGLSKDSDGLLILPNNAEVGQSLARHLGRTSEPDVIFDLEITPNRPDLNSFIGIAREISALTGAALKVPSVDIEEDPAISIQELVEVQLPEPDLCRRYTARVIRGLKTGPSPSWIKTRLEKVGIRSINNVVDVTNYVLMETGHPLHAFDYHLLQRDESGPEKSTPRIVVRTARAGESLTTLDGQERECDSETLLITDDHKGIALAGIMGGLNSEIQDTTQDVLIESAWFKPQNVRATSRKMSLATDASYRFERGADLEICDWASRRAARLILETAGGRLVQGVVDAYPQPHVPTKIRLRYAKTQSLLGVDIPGADQDRFLKGLEICESGQGDQESKEFVIPAFRVDLKIEVDLIEEIARLYGVDKIPSSPPRGAIGANAFDAVHDQLMHCRNLMVGLGLNEIQGQTLVSGELTSKVTPAFVRLQRPLSSDMDVLRPSLLPGMLEVMRHNVNHGSDSVRLFELGRVFTPGETCVKEESKCILGLTGQRYPGYWSGTERGEVFNLFDLKGMVEVFLDFLGAGGIQFQRHPKPGGFLLEAADLVQGKVSMGFIGQLHPLLAREFDLKHPVYIAELDLDGLLKRRKAQKNFKPMPSFPSVRRDVAMLLSEKATHQDVLDVIRKTRIAFLEAVDLFDVYRGQNVPEQHKSVAYALTYRNPQATLTDAQVTQEHEKVLEALKSNLGAVIR